MEEDLPCRYEDKKLPILDMKCWIDEEGVAQYMHYEKEVASKQIIPARSAHSNSSKRSVHISEIVRRCLNTSQKLGWEEYFVPTLEDYMTRMMKVGYNESYRRDVLAHAIHIYEKKVSESAAGGVPLNRPNSYQRVERRKAKQDKKRNWTKKGGYSAPIIVPATPNSELAKMLRQIADQETNRSKRFKIVGKGGRTIESSLMRPNPMGSEGCQRNDCPVCTQNGGGKRCHVSNVCYDIKCRPCEDAVYFGETNRNMYTRSREHQEKLRRKEESSFMHKHQVEKHNGEQVEFQMRMLRSFKDPLSRQVTEAIMIKNHRGQLLNSKAEFHQPPIVRIRNEIIRGLEN